MSLLDRLKSSELWDKVSSKDVVFLPHFCIDDSGTHTLLFQEDGKIFIINHFNISFEDGIYTFSHAGPPTELKQVDLLKTAIEEYRKTYSLLKVPDPLATKLSLEDIKNILVEDNTFTSLLANELDSRHFVDLVSGDLNLLGYKVVKTKSRNVYMLPYRTINDFQDGWETFIQDQIKPFEAEDFHASILEYKRLSLVLEEMISLMNRNEKSQIQDASSFHKEQMFVFSFQNGVTYTVTARSKLAAIQTMATHYNHLFENEHFTIRRVNSDIKEDGVIIKEY